MGRYRISSYDIVCAFIFDNLSSLCRGTFCHYSNKTCSNACMFYHQRSGDKSCRHCTSFFQLDITIISTCEILCVCVCVHMCMCSAGGGEGGMYLCASVSTRGAWVCSNDPLDGYSRCRNPEYPALSSTLSFKRWCKFGGFYTLYDTCKPGNSYCKRFRSLYCVSCYVCDFCRLLLMFLLSLSLCSVAFLSYCREFCQSNFYHLTSFSFIFLYNLLIERERPRVIVINSIKAIKNNNKNSPSLLLKH